MQSNQRPMNSSPMSPADSSHPALPVIEDLGHSLVVYPQTQSFPSIVRKHGSIVEDVKEWISQSLRPSINGSWHLVPRPLFQEIMSYENILEIVKQKNSFPWDTSANKQSNLARVIYQGTDDRPPARMLLAVLVMLGIYKEIQHLIDDDMSDDCLPPLIQKGKHTGEFTITCPVHTNGHRALDQLLLGEGTGTWKPGDESSKFPDKLFKELRKPSPQEYVEWSRRFRVPFIAWIEGRRPFHYVIRNRAPLPMIPEQEERSGRFSNIIKVRIDAGDRSFESPQGEPELFALRKIRTTLSPFGDSIPSWIAGIDVDSELRKRQGDEENHIIPKYDILDTKDCFVKLLATFEVYDYIIDTRPSVYVLCPWAEWNLDTYRKAHSKRYSPLNVGYLKWTIRNFLHVAKALHYLHEDSKLGKRASAAKATDNPGYYNSSPIHPRNVLVFTARGYIPGELDDSFRSTMALSEFSLSASLFAANTAPPDVGLGQDNKESYRDSNVFNFGCLLLEHLVWLFRGLDGLEKFSMARLEVDPRSDGETNADTFWKPTSTETGQLKDIVKSTIAELRDRSDCVEAAGDLLIFIEEDLLDMNPRSRMESSQILVLGLGRIMDRLEQDDSLYGSRIWKSSRRPNPPPSQASPGSPPGQNNNNAAAGMPSPEADHGDLVPPGPIPAAAED
ncbi:hypothetical protein QBC37DRAFT_322259, partial [Rhypophila decipiens]